LSFIGCPLSFRAVARQKAKQSIVTSSVFIKTSLAYRFLIWLPLGLGKTNKNIIPKLFLESL
jgi:hypothetical protein